MASAAVAAALIFASAVSAHAECRLNSPGGAIKHVVYLEFDNVHFTRDNPSVPSDLEQMPNLLNFLKGKGTLDAGDHAVLISHTANDILTTQTGLYSDRDGISVANSFDVFGLANPNNIFSISSFFYWTDLVSDINTFSDDHTFAMVTDTGLNTPAPWCPSLARDATSAHFRPRTLCSSARPSTSPRFSAQARRRRWNREITRTRTSSAKRFIARPAVRCAPRAMAQSTICCPANRAAMRALAPCSARSS
jgi:hypothetical protein